MNSKKKSIILLIASLLLTLLFSCKESKIEFKKIDFVSDYKFSHEIEEKLLKDTIPWKHQLSAADYATKGDYKNALVQWDLAMGARESNYTSSQIDSINNKYTKVNALDYIVEQAKKTQVVIINEAHHNSYHRVFTKSLLQQLYDNGYTNLGLEALGTGAYLDNGLQQRKYPILETGFYTKDPQFGDMIRTALEIGYTLFAYEDMGKGNGKPREIAQAKNIQKVIDSKPGEKFLIHCGFDHALEGVHRSWEKAMAGRLTEYTGINPLTINQVLYSEKSDPKFNHPFLKAVSNSESTVLIDQNNQVFRYKRGDAWSDIAVFHPNTTYTNNRPNWLFTTNSRPVSVSLTDLQIAFPVMVLAFKKGEDLNKAVPMDITEVENKTASWALGLKGGDYTIVLTNGEESVKFEYIVN